MAGSATLPIEDSAFFTDDLFVVYHTIELDEERLGTIHAEIDLAPMQLRLQQFTMVVVGLMLLLPTATWLVSARLQRFISGPILDLVDKARTVSVTKDYSIRATKRTNDEVGLLIENFNQMLEQIQDRDNQLLGVGAAWSKRSPSEPRSFG